MDKKDYEKLNGYLNDIFIALDIDDSFLTRNISEIFKINDDFLTFIDKYKLDNNTKQNNLTYNDVFTITREIIASIDKSYLNDYDDLIKSGRLDFGYNKEHNGAWFVHKNNLINIDREFNYNDVVFLVHEFIHYTNGKNNRSKNRYLLTEFLSIYFEIYAIDYLIKQGVPQEEIGIFDRLEYTKRTANRLYGYEIVFLVYEKFGSITEDTIEYLNKYYLNMPKEHFDNECKAMLDYILRKENEYKNKIGYEKEFKTEEFICETFDFVFSDYRYLLGTLMAFYARNYCKMEDIVNLNNSINNFDIGNMNVVDVLKKLGIDLNNEQFLNKILDSVDAYINEYTTQKNR